MSNFKIQGEVSLSTENADQAFVKVEKGASRMAESISNAGKKAGSGLGEVGNGGDASAAKVDRATRSMVASIQRATAAAESLGKSKSEMFESLANQRGIDTTALRPYLAQLEAVTAKQEAAALSSATMQTAFKAAGVGLGTGIVALAALVGRTIDAADGMNDLSKTTGIAVEQLAGLKLAAQQSGGDLEGIAKSINKLSTNIGKDGEKFRQLGIDAKDPVEAFKQLSDIFKSIEDPQTRAALGAAALGKSWESAAPLLSEGSKSIGEMVSKGTELSGVTQQLANDADAFNDAVAELKTGISGQLSNATSALLPLMLELSNSFKGTAASAKNSPNDFAPLTETFRALIVLGGNVAFVFKGVGNEIGGIASQIAALAQADVKGALAIGDLMKEDAVEARKAFDEWEKRILQVGTVAKQTEKEVAKALSPDESAAKAAAEAKAKSFIKSSDAVVVAINKEEKAYDTLIKSIKKNLEVREAEIALGRSMTALEKEREALLNTSIASSKKSAIADKERVLARLDLAIANEKNALYAKKSADENANLYKTIDAEIASIKKQVEAQNEYNDKIGLTKDAIVDLEIAKLNDLATGKERNAQMLEEIGLETDLIQSLRDQANGYKDLAKAKKIGSEKLAADDLYKEQEARSLAAIKAQQEEWTRFYSDIYSGLSDSLYRGFEAGKGFFQNFWDGIKNLFKTTVLKLAVQGVMTGVLGGVAGTASAATVPSALNTVSSLVGAGKSIYEGIGAIGTSAGVFGSTGFMASLAGGLQGAGVGSGLTSASGLAIGNGLNSVLGSTASGALSTGVTSISSALGAIPVWGWAALGAAAVAKLSAGGDRVASGAQTVTGALGTNNITRNVGWTKDGGWFNADTSGVWNYGLSDSTAMASNGQRYTDTASLASDKALLATLNTSYDALKQAATGFAESLGLNAESIKARNDQINFALGKTADETNAAMQKALGGIADSIAASLLPNFKELAKEGETASTTLARLAGTFGTVNQTLGSLGLKLFQLGEAGVKAASSFVDLFGGLEGLQSASASYYENFFSQEEKTANALKAVGAEFDKLSLGTLPSTRAEYRKLVEDISKTGNAEQLAGLLKLSGAFAAVIPDAQAVVEKVEKVDESLSRFTAATDAAASPLVKVSSALDETSEAAQKAASILSERNNLQEQIDAATMTSAQLLEKQRNALDESNRAKFDELQVALSSKQAADALAQTNKGILDQIESLVRANETVEQARARELKGVDESTAALKRRLYSLQDEAKAQADLKARQDERTAAFNDLANSALNGLEATRKSFENLANTMKQARDSLLTGSQSGFNSEERLLALKQQLSTASAADTPALANSYLQALKESGVGGVDYQREFASLVNRLDGMATDAQAQAVSAGDTSQLAPFFDVINRQRTQADLRDALNTEYSTYARELPTLSTEGFVQSVSWGNKLTEAMGSFNTNSDETNKALLAEIKSLREASEKTAALLDSVTAGGNAMLMESA